MAVDGCRGKEWTRCSDADIVNDVYPFPFHPRCRVSGIRVTPTKLPSRAHHPPCLQTHAQIYTRQINNASLLGFISPKKTNIYRRPFFYFFFKMRRQKKYGGLQFSVILIFYAGYLGQRSMLANWQGKRKRDSRLGLMDIIIFAWSKIYFCFINSHKHLFTPNSSENMK